MATTTNYSWTTPDDTALVKDGAAAIRSLGTAIDTTVFNNAGAAIAKTIVDAKGDIIAATAADTVSRLAVGANDTVLMADSSTATGLKWGTPAGGGESYTLLNAGGTTLSGSNSITISGISNAKSVFVVYRDAGSATANIYVSFRLNGNTGSVYDNSSYILWQPTNSYSGSSFSGGGINTNTSVDIAGTSNTADAKANGIVRIDGCSGAGVKPFYYTGGGIAQGGNYNALIAGGGIFNSSSTISSFTIRGTANFNSGIIYVYTSA